MTVAEIMASQETMLTPDDVAGVLGSHPATIRETAKQHPERIGYPFTFVGNRMKIPRIGFIRWLTGGKKGEGHGRKDHEEGL